MFVQTPEIISLWHPWQPPVGQIAVCIWTASVSIPLFGSFFGAPFCFQLLKKLSYEKLDSLYTKCPRHDKWSVIVNKIKGTMAVGWNAPQVTWDRRKDENTFVWQLQTLNRVAFACRIPHFQWGHHSLVNWPYLKSLFREMRVAICFETPWHW